VARGADEVTEDADVGFVGADAAGVHREAEAFGEIEIHTGVVELGKAITLSGGNAVQA
jgi:hypothetical protein